MITEARECEYLFGGSKQKFIVFLERLGNYEHWDVYKGIKYILLTIKRLKMRV